jgi:tRNA (guanine-N7-)-methyltransferase
MRFAPHFFRKGQLEKMFILFADPHFKRSNFRRRVIHANFLSIYAYCIRELYVCTDVYDLFEWEIKHIENHPLFERVDPALEPYEKDPCYIAMHHATEESQKVTRNKGKKWGAIYKRIAEPKTNMPNKSLSSISEPVTKKVKSE